MIESKNGCVRCSGDIVELVVETTEIMNVIYRELISVYGKQYADKIIVLMGRVSFVEDDMENFDEILESFKEDVAFFD